MNLLTEQTSNLSSTKPTKSFRKRWINFVDAGLHLCLPDEKVARVWRFLSKYNLWRKAGILAGSLILTISMQLRTSAQVLGDAEKEINDIFDGYLDGVTDFTEVLFGSGRLLLLVFGIGLVVYGIFDGIRGQGSNWHIWAGIGSTLILGIVLTSIWEKAIFG